MKRLLLGVFLFAGGCRYQKFLDLPAAEKTPFEHCRAEMARRSCFPGDYGCMTEKMIQYGDLKTSRERAEFLKYNGCPEQMIRVPADRETPPDAG